MGKRRTHILYSFFNPGVDFNKLCPPSKKLLEHSICQKIAALVHQCFFTLKLCWILRNNCLILPNSVCCLPTLCTEKASLSCIREKAIFVCWWNWLQGSISGSLNFINILWTTFLYQSTLHNLSLITFWLCNFFRKRISAQKLVVKCWWNWLLLRRLRRVLFFLCLIESALHLSVLNVVCCSCVLLISFKDLHQLSRLRPSGFVSRSFTLITKHCSHCGKN